MMFSINELLSFNYCDKRFLALVVIIYSFMIYVNDFNRLTVYGYDGAIDGVRSIIASFPKLKLTICFAFNASSVSSIKRIIQLYKAY